MARFRLDSPARLQKVRFPAGCGCYGDLSAPIQGSHRYEMTMLSSFDLSDEDALRLADASAAALPDLLEAAGKKRDASWGRVATFSPKVFLPLTNICRNRCDYCSFRRSPGD